MSTSPPAESLGAAITREDDPQYQLLRESNRDLERRLAREKARTGELVNAAYRGAREAMASLKVPVVNLPTRSRRSTRAAEIAVPLLSDLQLAKVTPTYNSDICAERVARYGQKIVELTEIQRSHHPVKRMHTAWLGDMVEGEMIFPGQAHLIDSGLYRQVMINGPEILVPWCLEMLKHFEEIEVTCVVGNHGRVGKRGDFNPETNADRMLYRFVATILDKEPKYRNRIKFNIPDGHGEGSWYSIIREDNYSALCIHGNQIKGNGPWHGLTLAKKVNGWAAGGIGRGISFQDVFMGHYHQIALIPLNFRKVYCNGSTESDNDFARETLSAQSDPKQWLLFADPEHGRITSSYDVELLS